jgi:trigger factor
VKATVEPLEGNKVKVSVEVDEQEFEQAVDAAFKKIAREVRIPGFRPGKAPRRLLESRLGTGAGRAQALNDSLPDYYSDAVRTHEVDVIAAPEIDVISGEDEGPVTFEAVVEVRPVIELTGYADLTVEIPTPSPTDEEIDAQIERIRSQFAELEVVERAAADGDYVTIDIEGSQDGEVLEGLVASAYLYEVGTGAIVPELDEQLRGASAGDELEFAAEHPNNSEETPEEPLHFEVSVTEVKAKVLPELDDELAAQASEFDTLADWRDDLVTRLTQVKRAQAQMAVREKIGEALAERSAKVDLALRAVAVAETIEALEEELEDEFAAVAARVDEELDTVRTQLTEAGHIPALRSDVSKRKALEWLTETVTIVDEDGNAIAFADLALDEADVDELLEAVEEAELIEAVEEVELIEELEEAVEEIEAVEELAAELEEGKSE